MDFNQIVDFVFQRWYIFVIVILGALALGFWSKSRDKKPQYWDQIKINKELENKESEFNPTEIKFIRHLNKTYRVYSELFQVIFDPKDKETKQKTTSEYTKEELKRLEIENLKNALKRDGQKDFKIVAHKFQVRRKCYDFILFKWYVGEKDFIVVSKDEFNKVKDDTIRINDTVRLVYIDGCYVSTKNELIEYVTDRTYRLMGDHWVNATGQQQKDFSRIRTDYAHQELMKDKDIEVEEKKDKAKRFG